MNSFISEEDKILAWHSPKADLRLPYKDGRRIKVGETLSVEPPIKLCKRGLHGSINILDTLYYSSSSLIARVELWGHIDRSDVRSLYGMGKPKIAAENRKTLCIVDASLECRDFALSIVSRYPKSFEIPELTSRYLSLSVENDSLRQKARKEMEGLYVDNYEYAALSYNKKSLRWILLKALNDNPLQAALLTAEQYIKEIIVKFKEGEEVYEAYNSLGEELERRIIKARD